MAIILNLETATTNCSVSISRNGEVAFLKESAEQGYSHAENLHLFIREGMQELGLEYADLDAVAVSMGPGSYTGLRIGVSAAKGICFAADKPLIAIPTLKVLEASIEVEEGMVIPILDARRMEVYAAVYNAKGEQIGDTCAEILTPESFSACLDQGSVLFTGNAVEKCQGVITHPNAKFTDYKLPSAADMGKPAQASFEAARFEDVAYFEPYYLKDFMAPKKK